MILGFIGCIIFKNEFDIGKKSDIQITKRNISLSVKDGTLKNTGATFILKNDSNKLLKYDEVYKIEIKQNNGWYKISAELFFNMPLLEVRPNRSEELVVQWKHGYGKLAKGDYRIIKEVYFEKESEQKFYISSEFTIK